MPVETKNQATIEIPEEYRELFKILMESFNQCSRGKGKHRHAHNGASFMEQDIIDIQRRVGMPFAAGQALKKIREACYMEDWEAARRDLLGAIIYTAACIAYGDEKNDRKTGLKIG